jgi:hypothetical protein
MRSEIMGHYETLVQPSVEKIRAPALVGATITLSPDAAKAIANNMEALAKLIDVMDAESEDNRRWLLAMFGTIAVVAFFTAMHWLTNL